MARKDITDRQVCEAYRDYKKMVDEERRRVGFADREYFNWDKIMRMNHVPYPYELLEQRTGQPFKVCYRAMERAERRGLIDYGVSLRTGFLTPEGKKLIEQSSVAVNG